MLIIKKYSLAVFFGLIIGAFSGLIGVSGGEFRLPVLIGLLGFNITLATATNLLIGSLVSLAIIFTRYPMMTPDAYITVLIMGATSLIGGYVGVHLQGKIKENLLRPLLIIFLAIVGLHFISANFLHIHITPPILNPQLKLFLFALTGVIIGIFSGIFGVAGGEFRIPTLIFLFNIPIKLAGTVSSFVALPTQIGGLLKHFKVHRIPKDNIIIAIIMGISSIIGSLYGATLLSVTTEKLLEIILGVLLLIASFCLYKPKLKHKEL